MAIMGAGPSLRGRVSECAALRALVSGGRSGGSAVLVVRGEAGVGKTALLDYVVEHAPGFRVTQVAGVESDMELAFAGLHHLCAPLLDHLDKLPEPQREALSVAFGRGVGPVPDRFLVGLAVLSLLAAAADDKPLLCVIDDAQWLDQVSVQTLGFVARRLLAEPVVLVFGVRDSRDGSADVLPGLPELRVEGLSDSDARDLLDSVVLGRLDERVRDRVIAETRGNPLALLEVPRNVSAAELAGGFWLASARLSVGQVEEGFIRRIQSLPADTRQLVLVAAADPVGDPMLFSRAAGHLGIGMDALAPAEAAGVIEFGSRMRFHHPLVRSAAYRAAEAADRREVHRALAVATDPDLDPDRRAWHAANAAAGPDDAVAAELEASAWRAQGRGGIAAAATFLERAAVLTADPALRSSRAIAAAAAKREAAAPEAAYELLSLAELSPLTELQQAQVGRLRAQMEFTRSRGGLPGAPPVRHAAALLLDAAKRLENLDDELARETYIEALAAAMYASRSQPEALVLAAEAAYAAVAGIEAPARPIDFLLIGMATLVTDGLPAAVDHLRTALELWCEHARRHDGRALHWLALAFPIMQESLAGEIWDNDLIDRLATDMIGYARATGALALLPPVIAYQAGVHVLEGEFVTAARLLEEADTIAEAIGHHPMKYHKVELAAWRGDLTEAGDLIEAGRAEGIAKGEGRLLGVTGYVAAVLYNGLGRYEEALAAAQQACEYHDLGFYGWCLLELTEAGVRVGKRDVAEDAVRRLEAGAGASETDWGLGTLASARALVADGAEADALFNESIERLGRSRVGVQLARTHLRYGEWLRRQKQRASAREHLNTAYEMFTKMGAQAFAERARRELTATGEKVRKQPLASGDELTAQEAQIAQLARDGLTNQEIGAQLFISTHTVEWHLRKVFVKLGLSSRRQLRSVSWTS
ncbi:MULTISPECIES: AAA family ATPase [unclassified Mycolicibacterium]|uniref:AAA family ATPase n=3 Tax=Mycolicibacterium TaxID=1866885 RepID=UPI0012DDAEEE|nr:MULTISPECIES: LuxR family transcriptional regulator [unclassified Mycolicibacterium]MUL84271.1 helix-turn-helix domain-containing protein [Mycolicibacterium sp. CBMA 329]MUL89663.1 helix-turn-helix domain-containing protein [Mycolicibacterium sp. CBMA 331]MUL99838.1 helix-turn-helix domain-containing protein [Mycolicibacterium sp. CBMA 334]MUM39178.1 helix-turn-helix domain-containing protein [Mycolicibacterium sp. CBMA 247]MUM46264.1 helix-turn-helix domain-containing protein [Mycolicibact